MKDNGYIWLPYVTKVVSTSVNGETVWYANKLKNFLLKLKYFFTKSRHSKTNKNYSKIKINSSQYLEVKTNERRNKKID